MILVDQYKIHCDTYLIRTVFQENQSYSVIYEKGQKLHIKTKPLKLIDSACQKIGSNFQTAADNARQVLGNKLKVPIVVGYEGQKPFIMFPLYSPKSNHNIWIAYNAIVHVANHKKTITLTFKDETTIELPILISSFNNQYVSSAMLSKFIEENWKRFNSLD